MPDSAASSTAEAREGRFILLFVLVLALHVAVPLLRNVTPLHTIVSSAMFVVIAYAGWITVDAGRLRAVYLAVLVVCLISSVVAGVVTTAPVRVSWLGCHAVVLGLVTALVIRWTVRRRRVTGDTIFAALSGFYFMGFAWALLYSLLDSLMPGSFSVRLALQDAFYFSFVTITTLGYGDIVPIEPLSRALVTTEALIGQIYLVVLVARLVSLRSE